MAVRLGVRSVAQTGSLLRKRKYILGGRAYYEPLEWLWSPPTPKKVEDPETGWDINQKRVGVIGKKLGMHTDFDQYGNMVPITLIEVEKNYVVQQKTMEKDGYIALQVGAYPKKEKNTTAQLKGHFKKAGAPICRRLTEFRVTEKALLPVGTSIEARHFEPGQFLDIQGVSVGKGFQGGMKRWGFAGLPASHGVSKAHRSIGSTGACQDPGKVWKGKKMAGQMGNKTCTLKNLQLYKVDPVTGILAIRGNVPGKPGSLLKISDAKNKELPGPPHFPTFVAPENDSMQMLEGELKMPYLTKMQQAHPPTFAPESARSVQKRLGYKHIAEYRKEVQDKIDARDKSPMEWDCKFFWLEEAHEEFDRERGVVNEDE